MITQSLVKKLAPVAFGAVAMVSAVPAVAESSTAPKQMVQADVTGADGKSIGMVMVEETPAGVLIKTDLKSLPAGDHGFHFHGKGICDASAKFSTAGGHFAGGHQMHGLMVEGGPHGGDMPNQHVGADGILKAEILNTGVTLSPGAKSLFDADGSALVIHAKPDDYSSQPSGNAGDRIACAVIVAPK